MSNLFISLLQLIATPVGVAVAFAIAVFVIVRSYRHRSAHMLPGTGTQVATRLAGQTILIRTVVAALLLGVYAATVFLMPRETVETQASRHLPDNGSGILVVDVSGSISEKNMELIAGLFDEAIERELRLGLVLFAGDGYVLFGPNTPAEQTLETMKLYFVERYDERGRRINVNPWAIGSGTQMIHGVLDGIALREMFAARGAEDIPLIIISDLQDHGNSKIEVLEELAKIRSADGTVYIVDLNVGSNTYYSGQHAQQFEAILGEEAFIRDFSMLQPVDNDGRFDVRQPKFAAEEIFAALAASAIVLILLDAFVLPRIPTKSRRE